MPEAELTPPANGLLTAPPGEGRRAVHFAGSTILIEWQGRPAGALVEFVFGRTAQGHPATAQVTFRLSPAAGGLLRLENSAGQPLNASPAMAAVALMEQATYHLLERATGGLALHAGLIVRDGRALLLPGTSGSGKSTLALWLGRHGWQCLADEVVFIPTGGPSVEGGRQAAIRASGLARPAHLKPASAAACPQLIGPGSLPLETGGWLVPPDHADYAQSEGLPVAGILFPHFQPGAQPQVQPLSRASAAAQLAEVLVNARNLPGHGFAALVALARTVPAWAAAYGGFEGLVEKIEGAARD